MEVAKIADFVLGLVLVGMLIGVGLVIFSGFGSSPAAYGYTAVVGEEITIPDWRDNVSLANTRVSVSRVYNVSGSTVSSAAYTVISLTGIIKDIVNSSTCFEGDTCYVDYTWENRNSSTTKAMTAVSGSLGSIATSWLSIFVIIIVCSVILGLVMRSFMGGRK